MLLVCGVPLVSFAQSTLFDVPSTDTQTEDTIYVEFDFNTHLGSYRNGGFQAYNPIAVYGLSKNLEVGVNLDLNKSVDGLVAELQPNIKWKFYENAESNVAASVGAITFIPLNKDASPKPYAMLYSNISKKFTSANGLRLTGGVYAVATRERDFGTKTGLMIGIEQPVNSKLTIMGEWASGKNQFGSAIVGFSYLPTDKHAFGAGYGFSNAGRGNDHLTVFYGITF